MDPTAGFRIASIEVEPRNGRVLRDGAPVEVEPKVMDLLCLLAREAGETVSRDMITAEVWDGRVVNDDALARTIFKLRRALGDDARNPRYVATVPKRGYRLLVAPEPLEPGTPAARSSRRPLVVVSAALVLLVIAALAWRPWEEASEPAATDGSAAQLVQRADDSYAQITEADNASAMRLYEQALAIDPESAPAHAGLANTLTQAVIRWSPGDWPETGERSAIRAALASGRTESESSRRQLERALEHAHRALEIDPGYALGYRALGLALSATGEIDAAIEAYDRAVTIDPDAWEALINLSDLHAHRGDAVLSLGFLEQTYDAMSRVYDDQAVRIRPWYSLTGINIAEDYRALGDPGEAERWYRRVLHWDPFNPEAVTGLAAVLLERGDVVGARETCAVLPTPAEIEACQGDDQGGY